MKELVIYLVIFSLVYLVYLIFVILKKTRMKDFKDNSFVNYLVKVYKLDYKKINVKFLAHIMALANAFIIATTFTIISLVNNLILMMFLALIILIPLQLGIYHIIGKMLQRRDKKCIILKK